MREFLILWLIALPLLGFSQNNNLSSEVLNTALSNSIDYQQATPTYISIVFQLEMYDGPINPETDTVYISGSFNNWLEPGAEGSYMLVDGNEDLLYVISIQFVQNSGPVQYKYYINSGYDGAEWEGDRSRTILIEERGKTVYDIWGGNGVNDSFANKLVLFPNPCNSELSISGLDQTCEVLIINSLGSIKFQNHVSPFNPTINTSSLSDGVYLVSFILQNQQVKTLRFVKQ